MFVSPSVVGVPPPAVSLMFLCWRYLLRGRRFRHCSVDPVACRACSPCLVRFRCICCLAPGALFVVDALLLALVGVLVRLASPVRRHRCSSDPGREPVVPTSSPGSSCTACLSSGVLWAACGPWLVASNSPIAPFPGAYRLEGSVSLSQGCAPVRRRAF